jgi:hypothetical protein
VLKKNGFLVIFDFDPGYTYTNKYKHHPDILTFKEDYGKIFFENGFYLITKENFLLDEVGFSRNPVSRISVQLLNKN